MWFSNVVMMVYATIFRSIFIIVIVVYNRKDVIARSGLARRV